MKYTLTILVFSFFLNVLFINAQDTNKSFMNLQEFEKNKREFIMKEAGLTQLEADKFFPLNSELQKKKMDLHRQHQDYMKHTKDGMYCGCSAVDHSSGNSTRKRWSRSNSS